MTFIVRAIETVTEFVDVYYPDQEAPVQMPVVIRYIGEKEREELMGKLDAEKCKDLGIEVMTDEEIMQHLIRDIPDLADEDGNALSYDKALLEKLLDVRCYREALQHLIRCTLYSKEFAEKFRQKNLWTQAATGPK